MRPCKPVLNELLLNTADGVLNLLSLIEGKSDQRDAVQSKDSLIKDSHQTIFPLSRFEFPLLQVVALLYQHVLYSHIRFRYSLPGRGIVRETLYSCSTGSPSGRGVAGEDRRVHERRVWSQRIERGARVPIRAGAFQALPGGKCVWRACGITRYDPHTDLSTLQNNTMQY